MHTGTGRVRAVFTQKVIRAAPITYLQSRSLPCVSFDPKFPRVSPEKNVFQEHYTIIFDNVCHWPF